ncbi:MAG: hypothetical protein WBA88_13485 [Pseudaminobacter sp.]
MAKRPEKPVFCFIRKGNVLAPEMSFDLRALDGVANGQRVKIEVKEFRNLGRHRAYWAMLQEVIDATDCALSAERLHEVLKLETGVVDLIRLPTGMTVAIPGSIAFDKMAEDEFVAFFAKAQQWLAETYGWVSEREQAA